MEDNPLLQYVDVPKEEQANDNPLLQYVDNGNQPVDYSKYRPTDYFPNDKFEDSRFVEKTNVLFESAKKLAIGGEGILSNVGTMFQAIGDNMKLSEDEYAKSLEQGWGKDGLDRMQKVSQNISDWGRNASTYWDNQQKSGWEVLNKEVWSGSYTENPSFTRTVAIGVGAIPSLASGYIAAVAAGPMAGFVFLSGLSAAETYKKADVAGKSQTEKNVLAGTVGVGTGVLERYIGPLNNYLKGGVGRKIADVFIGGAKESITEGSQQVLQNTVEKYGIDNTISIFDGVVESMVAGGLAGGTMGAMTSNTSNKMKSAIDDMKSKGASDEEVSVVIESVGQAVISKADIIEEGISNIKNEVSQIHKEIIAEQEAVSKQNEVIKINMQEGEAKTSDIKNLIRETTGQIKDEGNLVSEKKAFLQSLKDRVKAAAQSRKATREEIFDVQSDVIDLIKKSDLDLNDKAKFLTAVKNIQTQEDFNRVMPELEERIFALEENFNKKQIASKINKLIDSVEKSNIISVDYVNLIKESVAEFDLKGIQDKTLKKLNATKAYIDKQQSLGEDVVMPKDVIESLSRLSKKNIDNLESSDLQDLLDKLELLKQLGKTKLSAREENYKSNIDKAIDYISAGSSNIDLDPLVRPKIGEKLTAKEAIRNKVIEYKRIVKEKDLALLGQDVLFDIADGNKNFKGPNYTYIKKPIDIAYNKYLNLKDKIKSQIISLVEDNKLDSSNFDRIGAYAVKLQEGGLKRLLNSGYSQIEIDSIELTDSELIVYKKMRSILDELRPEIERVMREVYNKPLGEVDNYFSFMTDFDKMEDVDVSDKFSSNQKNVERGFTESRTNGGQPIKINALEVFLKHTDNAAYLIEAGAAIKKAGDIVDNPKYGQAVGSIMKKEIRDWVSLMARKGGYQNKNIALETLRRNVAGYVLAYKLGSVLVQPTALANGASEVGADRISKSLIDIAKSEELRSFMMKNFPELRDRFGDDPAYVEFSGHYGDIGLKDKAINTGFLGIKYVDMFTASVVAHAAYIKALDARGLEFDINNINQEAMLEAQFVMRRTQSTSLFKDAPQAITNGKLFGDVSWDKLVTQFQSYMLNDWSRIRYDLIERGIAVGNYNRAFNIATAMIISSAMTIAVADSVKVLALALGSDDDEKKKKNDADTFLDKLSMELLRKVPILSQAMSAVGYGSMPVPSIEIIKRTFDRLNRAFESKGKTRKSKDAKVDNIIKSAIAITSIFRGVPGGDAMEDTYQLLRDMSD